MIRHYYVAMQHLLSNLMLSCLKTHITFVLLAHIPDLYLLNDFTTPVTESCSIVAVLASLRAGPGLGSHGWKSCLKHTSGDADMQESMHGSGIRELRGNCQGLGGKELGPKSKSKLLFIPDFSLISPPVS